MDMELLEWLNKNAFPEEAKYRDSGYASEAYARFIIHEKKGPNTRLCVFASIHVPSTILLMDMLEESGLVCLIGKVNMDRNCPEYLREDNSTGATREWLESFFKGRKDGRYKNSSPILTPRFIPSCSGELMKSLGKIQREYGLPVQSHLSENRKEIEWVKTLCPESENYADAYANFGLLGNGVPTVMAHCVWSDEKEMDFLAKRGVYVAHCPQSNMNLSSGIAPVRSFMERGINLGLGSDVAGGTHSSIFRAMTDAIQVSKLRQTLISPAEKALTMEEAFYMGSAGGGSFFGKLHSMDESSDLYQGAGPSGSFESGWDFDALIIDDSNLGGNVRLSIRDRLERVVYLSDDRHIIGKYVRGVSVF
jgi:guanine deaminase